MQSVSDLLEQKRFFKLVCGAGNEDPEVVKKLVYIYAKAGCKVFDISAGNGILDAAKAGAETAGKKDVHFCVSIGIKGDPHIFKAKVNNLNCICCGNCSRICPQGAIFPPNLIDEKKCIGCGTCLKKCPVSAISMYEKDINFRVVLPELVKKGAEILELHVMGNDKRDLGNKWEVINDCNPKFVSICVDRESMGNCEVISLIKEMISIRQPFTTIIQADGIPMSGAEDDYKTTLQAVAMAEIIQNANLPVYLTVSGGTNSKTIKLCEQCGIYPHGIAIGSWARKIVKPYIDKPDFWENNAIRESAIKSAKELVNII